MPLAVNISPPDTVVELVYHSTRVLLLIMTEKNLTLFKKMRIIPLCDHYGNSLLTSALKAS
jgi:hypothetical protein